MARPPSAQPTEGELEILKVLWEQGPSGLSAVCAGLRKGRPVATTTVATMLKLMQEKGLVDRGEAPAGLGLLGAGQPRGGQHEPGAPADGPGLRRLRPGAGGAHARDREAQRARPRRDPPAAG